jgi:hypothetical protein
VKGCPPIADRPPRIRLIDRAAQQFAVERRQPHRVRAVQYDALQGRGRGRLLRCHHGSQVCMQAPIMKRIRPTADALRGMSAWLVRSRTDLRTMRHLLLIALVALIVNQVGIHASEAASPGLVGALFTTAALVAGLVTILAFGGGSVHALKALGVLALGTIRAFLSA